MPPKTLRQRQAKSSGKDPTVTIATASAAKALNAQEQTQVTEQSTQQKTNDDLKKLIETLKNKIGNTSAPAQKQSPPVPQAKSVWNRSTTGKSWAPKPAYTLLTRISNHEKVPVRAQKSNELTINSLPHSFLYRPGADGIKVDKVSIKAGRQICMG